MKKLFVVLIVVGLLAAACGGGGGGATKPADESDSARPTVEFKTPPPEPTAAQLKPTNTPVPPPPTPTAKPTVTPAPVEEETEPGTEEAAQPAVPAINDDMVEIPAGPFTMGVDDADAEDAPAHEVDLPAFKIDRFEVTNADFAAFVDATGYVTSVETSGGGKNWRDYADSKDNHPVVKVTFPDAMAFCEWAGKRLPTEAEWEKAARGADALRFPWGNDWDPSKGNVKVTGIRGTAAVGSFGGGASPYGVEDMIGNVWEWTSDWYQAYPGNTASDPYYGEQCRSTRGGGWFDEEAQSTAFNRNCAVPDVTANDELGFRCVMSME